MDNLLLESGDYLLLENGVKLLLESAVSPFPTFFRMVLILAIGLSLIAGRVNI